MSEPEWWNDTQRPPGGELVKWCRMASFGAKGRAGVNITKVADRILELEADNAMLREALGQHDGDLNERMAALGMVPLDKLLSQPPTPFSVHAAMKDMDSFVWWVNSKNREYTTMRMRYETGEREKNDDLYEWVFAHSAVFGAIADNLRAALEGKK